jgi:predicted GIY-YIG superfamily endonuclease
MFCYVLKLSDDKWYIGKSNSPIERITQHLNGNGSEWTKKYKPLAIVETREISDGFEEDLITKRYMAKYGINNVRGGTYCTIDLDKNTIKFLEKEFTGASDLCYLCGVSGHFAKECPSKKSQDCSNEIFNSSEEYCERCGRDHDTSNCYAKRDINGNKIFDKNESICNIQ